jgi:hypothetical protein
MSATTALAIAMLICSLSGAAAAVSMGRRGHDRLTWWLLGTVLGPLVVPLALVTVVESPRSGTAAPRALAGPAPDGPDRPAEKPRRPPMAGSALAASWIEAIGTQGGLPSL